MGKKVVGLEATFTKIFDLFDTILALSAGTKGSFKYGKVDWDVYMSLMVDPLLPKFSDMCLQFSQVTTETMEQQLVEEHVANLLKQGFTEVPGLKYNYQEAFILKSTLLQLFMNQGLPHKGYKAGTLQEMIPPQQIFEIMIDIINNKHIGKDSKDSICVVMSKLIQIDVVPRFRIEPASKNPYFTEASKYHQTYIEIFQESTRYHLVTKVEERQG